MQFLEYTLLSVFFPIILLIAYLTLNNRSGGNSLIDKQSPFECGFDPLDTGRLPFSLRFFLLAIIFLVFDIEIALLFPIIIGMKLLYVKTVIFAGVAFLIVLLLGLCHE